MIAEWTTAVLIVVGTAFSVLAAVGLLRMPDLYMRMQAATKSSTLGVSCIVLAAAVWFEGAWATTTALLVIAFLFLTAPVAAHMIGRAAYSSGVKLWAGTIDELKPHETEERRDSMGPHEAAEAHRRVDR